MPKNNFFQELKRRNVYKVAITYLVTSWLIFQAAAIFLPTFEAPHWIMKVLTFMLIIGFPIALILAWAFEMSPQGIIRTSSAASEENAYPNEKKKPLTSNLLIGFLLLLLIGQFVCNKYSNLGGVDKAKIEKSIAVLPFDDISQNKDQAYFSIGISDEIRNHLYKLGGLKIPSRTSSMRFKESNKTIKEFAKDLGVAHILEGSVRKYGDKIKIIVSLIDVGKNTQIWSYDEEEKIKDVFAIEGIIAQRVAKELSAHITPAVKQRINKVPTQNMEAYDLFLEARYVLNNIYGSSETARTKMEKAISLDPNFASAYALLAFYWMLRGAWGGDLGVLEVRKKVSPILTRALKLDENNFDANFHMAVYRLWFYWDFEGFEKYYSKAHRLNPSNMVNISIPINFYEAAGRSSEAVKLAELALQNNRTSEPSYGFLSYYFDGQPEKAIHLSDTAFEFFPQHGSITIDAISLYNFTGNYRRTIEVINSSSDTFVIHVPHVLAHFAIAYNHTNQVEKGSSLLKKLIQKSQLSSAGSPSFYTAMIYADMGEVEQAFQWLGKAYDDLEVEMYWLKVNPLFKTLHNDPRWQQLLDKIGFPE